MNNSSVNSVLCVEDCDADYEMIEIALNDCGVHLRRFRDCEGVCEDAFQHRPSFCVLDLNLQKCDGATLAARIRCNEQLKSTPIVIFTASNNPDDRIRAISSGVDDYRVKPMDANSYVSEVKDMYRVWSSRAIS